MTTEAELIDLLAEAQRTGTHPVDASLYASLDRQAAYRIQLGVLAALGETVGMLKLGIQADGVGVAAPIYGSRVGHAPDYRLPAANVTGLEVEVGMVLGKDVASPADIPAAIDHYFLGIEICGNRYRNRAEGGSFGGFADNMSALGYAIGPRRPLGTSIEGLDATLEFAGRPIYAAPARHGFGGVLNSLVAYAASQHPAYPLSAGTIVTTGSLCGLVPISGAGDVHGRLGDDAISFTII